MAVLESFAGLVVEDGPAKSARSCIGNARVADCLAVGQLPDILMAASSFSCLLLVLPAGASSYWLMIAGVLLFVDPFWDG